jgi:hypothetical protein
MQVAREAHQVVRTLVREPSLAGPFTLTKDKYGALRRSSQGDDRVAEDTLRRRVAGVIGGVGEARRNFFS